MPEADQLTGCPFLQPTKTLTLEQRAIGLYCRLPNGHVRVPPLDKRRRVCLVGRWRDCPVFQRYATH